MSDSLPPVDSSSPASSVHGIFQARILEWVCYSLLQGIFPAQESNLRLLCLLHWQVDSLPLCHLGSIGLGNLSVFEVYGSQKLWTTVSRKRLQQLGQQDKHEPQNVAFEVGDILN